MNAADTLPEAGTPRKPGQRPYETMVDVDIHPALAGGIEVALPYMPDSWRSVWESLPPVSTPSGIERPFPFTEFSLTPDARPPKGGPSGSDPAFMSKDLFDRHDIGIGQLILMEPIVTEFFVSDQPMQASLMSAFNDWLLDNWTADKRMRIAMLVSHGDPELAAAEIRRVGSHPSICSVMLMPPGNKPIGDRHYHPIMEAAVEHDLPLVLHSPLGVGYFQTYVESRVNTAIGGWTNITSLIYQGVFERYPSLKVMIVESGFSWVVPLMWRMDAAWRRNRYDVPWLKRWPTEYLQEHITLSTQPVDDDPDAQALYELIDDEASYLADVLVYASDYPHWDNDRPGSVLSRISDDAKRKIFSENAMRVLRLDR